MFVVATMIPHFINGKDAFEAFFIFELYDHFPELTERIPFIRSERPPEPPLPAKEPVVPPAPVEKEPAEAVPVG